MKNTKFVLVSLLLVPFLAFAQSSQTTLPSAGLTPESSFYFLDRLGENLRHFFTFNPEAKARLQISFAAERIAEIIVILETKGIFVAATVNGSPISRLSVIKELEKQGGKQALEAIIDKKLIETELNKKKVTATKEEVDAEIDKIKTQVTAQGGTLETALAQQGMTEEKLREQITIQKKLEKLLADKVAITDAEIDSYIKDSKATPPKDVKMEDFRKQISEKLKQQKFQSEAQKWVSNLTTNAKIKYYVNY